MSGCNFEAMLIITQDVQGTTTNIARRKIALRCHLPSGHDGEHHDKSHDERWESPTQQRTTLLRQEGDEASG